MHCTSILVPLLLLLCLVYGQLHPTTPARYRKLPSLREQATILDGWRDERVGNIPALLTKYRIDAWLVSPSLPSDRLGKMLIIINLCQMHYP